MLDSTAMRSASGASGAIKREPGDERVLELGRRQLTAWARLEHLFCAIPAASSGDRARVSFRIGVNLAQFARTWVDVDSQGMSVKVRMQGDGDTLRIAGRIGHGLESAWFSLQLSLVSGQDELGLALTELMMLGPGPLEPSELLRSLGAPPELFRDRSFEPVQTWIRPFPLLAATLRHSTGLSLPGRGASLHLQATVTTDRLLIDGEPWVGAPLEREGVWPRVPRLEHSEHLERLVEARDWDGLRGLLEGLAPGNPLIERGFFALVSRCPVLTATEHARVRRAAKRGQLEALSALVSHLLLVGQPHRASHWYRQLGWFAATRDPLTAWAAGEAMREHLEGLVRIDPGVGAGEELEAARGGKLESPIGTASGDVEGRGSHRVEQGVGVASGGVEGKEGSGVTAGLPREGSMLTSAGRAGEVAGSVSGGASGSMTGGRAGSVAGGVAGSTAGGMAGGVAGSTAAGAAGSTAAGVAGGASVAAVEGAGGQSGQPGAKAQANGRAEGGTGGSAGGSAAEAALAPAEALRQAAWAGRLTPALVAHTRESFEALEDWRGLLAALEAALPLSSRPEDRNLLHHELAQVKVALGVPSRAAPHFEALLAANPEDNDARDFLRAHYLREGLHAQRIRLEASLARKHTGPEAAVALEALSADAARHELFELSRILLTDACAANPAEGSLLARLTAELEPQEAWDPLIAAWKRRLPFLSHASDKLQAGLKIAGYMRSRGDLEASERLYRGILRGEPEQVEALEGLARVLEARENWPALAETLQQLSRLVGKSARVEIALRLAGLYDSRLGEPEIADGWYREALAESPQDARAARGVAQQLEARKDWPALAAFLEKRIATVEEPAARRDLLLFLGDVCLVRLQDQARALTCFQQADAIERSLSQSPVLQ